MNYELAAELMLAGFPQAGNGRWIGSPSALVLRSSDRVYVPTLEELIEACGVRFGSLHRNEDKRWTASINGLFSPPRIKGNGSTPTEAVARLWLALYANTGTIA